MANQCINQIIITGTRDDLIKLIQSQYLNYKKNKIYQLHENILMVTFKSDWNPEQEKIREMSNHFPKLKFELIYIEPLLNKAGIIWFEDNKINKHIIDLKNNLTDLKNKILPEVFKTIKGYINDNN